MQSLKQRTIFESHSNPPEVRFWKNSSGIYTQSESVVKLHYESATKDLSNDFEVV